MCSLYSVNFLTPWHAIETVPGTGCVGLMLALPWSWRCSEMRYGSAVFGTTCQHFFLLCPRQTLIINHSTFFSPLNLDPTWQFVSAQCFKSLLSIDWIQHVRWNMCVMPKVSLGREGGSGVRRKNRLSQVNSFWKNVVKLGFLINGTWHVSIVIANSRF